MVQTLAASTESSISAMLSQTGMFPTVMKVELGYQASCSGQLEGFVEGLGRIGAQVVQHDKDLLGGREVPVDLGFPLQSEIERRSSQS